MPHMHIQKIYLTFWRYYWLKDAPLNFRCLIWEKKWVTGEGIKENKRDQFKSLEMHKNGTVVTSEESRVSSVSWEEEKA